jgi:hypothetical protein
LTVDEIFERSVSTGHQLQALDLLRKTQEDNTRGIGRSELSDLFALMAVEAQDVLSKLTDQTTAKRAWEQLNGRWRRAIRDAFRE